MKKYSIRPPLPDEANENLAPFPEIVREMLWWRGIKTQDEADRFINPSYEEHTFDPFGIKNMDRAVDRILFAIDSGERIAIWSDYDCDGIPGGTILHDFFKKINYQNFVNYIPHRYLEGYGLNKDGISLLKEEGVSLMITVDSGITDIDPVSHANSLGIDVIVTDHHLPQEKLPEAFVILNSKQDGDNYEDNMLCGAAVAWKLVVALLSRGREKWGVSEGYEKWLLDLAGLSTIADMVPLKNENRVLAHYGLRVLRKTKRVGLLKLLHKAGVNPQYITEEDVGFSIAPRINAASRMGNPKMAFDLLSESDEARAGALADELEKLNSARKGVVASMVKEMKHHLSEKESIPSVIVLGNPHWRPGLLGLAANSLMEAHMRPVFLWGREGGESLKGSCRSDGSVNLVNLMSEVKSGVFTEFGGHAFSGGFSVSPDEVHYLENHLLDAHSRVSKEDAIEEVFIERILNLDDVSFSLWDNILKLAPFGEGNPKPVFLFKGIDIVQKKMFGKSQEHLELSFEKSNGGKIKAIEFFSGRENSLRESQKIDLVATIEKSIFGGRPELRLRIIDIL